MVWVSLAAGRVGFYRQPHNVGATANFNTCVERAVGHLVHILHGDDWVLPGFYDRIELSVRRHPDTAFFSTRAFIVDDGGNLDDLNQRTPSLEQPSSNITPFVYANPFCPPAIVVRRRFYEATGGFMPALIHTADWEMWVRAIGYGGGCVINQPLACYRKFTGNESNRLARTAENLRDFLRLCEIFTSHYGGFDRKAFLRMVVRVAKVQAQRFKQISDPEAEFPNEALFREASDMLSRT